MRALTSGFVAVALTVVTALTLTACGVGPDKSREDAHDTKDVDKSAPHVLAFNNHFPNVSTKCDGFGNRVYVATSGTVKFRVIPADPSCAVSR